MNGKIKRSKKLGKKSLPQRINLMQNRVPIVQLYFNNLKIKYSSLDKIYNY